MLKVDIPAGFIQTQRAHSKKNISMKNAHNLFHGGAAFLNPIAKIKDTISAMGIAK